MSQRIARQSEYYGGSEEALSHTVQAEASRRAASAFDFSHLLGSPGIGRLGDDPQEHPVT